MEALVLQVGDLAQIIDENCDNVLAIDESGDLFEIPSGSIALVIELPQERENWGDVDTKVMFNNRIGKVWNYECIPLKMCA